MRGLMDEKEQLEERLRKYEGQDNSSNSDGGNSSRNGNGNGNGSSGGAGGRGGGLQGSPRAVRESVRPAWGSPRARDSWSRYQDVDSEVLRFCFFLCVSVSV